MVLTKPWGGCYAATVKPLRVSLVEPVAYLKSELLSAFPRPAQDGHGAFAPGDVLLVLKRVNVQQAPPRPEQAVDFLAAFRFQVVSREFSNVQLPEADRLEDVLWQIAFNAYVQLLVKRHLH